MAQAMIDLVAQIERECALTGAKPNGVFRVKLQGRSIEVSYERHYATQIRRSVID